MVARKCELARERDTLEARFGGAARGGEDICTGVSAESASDRCLPAFRGHRDSTCAYHTGLIYVGLAPKPCSGPQTMQNLTSDVCVLGFFPEMVPGGCWLGTLKWGGLLILRRRPLLSHPPRLKPAHRASGLDGWVVRSRLWLSPRSDSASAIAADGWGEFMET